MQQLYSLATYNGVFSKRIFLRNYYVVVLMNRVCAFMAQLRGNQHHQIRFNPDRAIQLHA